MQKTCFESEIGDNQKYYILKQTIYLQLYKFILNLRLVKILSMKPNL
mgnify:CR=1 FL=1